MELSLTQIARIKTYRCIFFATSFCASGKCPHLPKCYTDPGWPDDRACWIENKKRCYLQSTCICTQAEPPSQKLLRAYSTWKERHLKENPEYDESVEIHGSYSDDFL